MTFEIKTVVTSGGGSDQEGSIIGASEMLVMFYFLLWVLVTWMSSQKIHQTLHLRFMYKELGIHCLKGKRVKQFDFCQLMWSGENTCPDYLDILP